MASASSGTCGLSASGNTQSRTFVNWINLLLKTKRITIKDLYSDLENGVMLLKLMECLAPDEKMPGRYIAVCDFKVIFGVL